MSSPASASGASLQQLELNHVSVRVPPFWPEDPQLLFVQLENQFEIARITSEDTKLSYMVCHLDAKYMRELRDILMNPPQTNKYLYLKTHLIKRLTASQQEMTCRLLEGEEMGNRKPSHFLRHLQELAGTNVPENIYVPYGYRDYL